MPPLQEVASSSQQATKLALSSKVQADMETKFKVLQGQVEARTQECARLEAQRVEAAAALKAARLLQERTEAELGAKTRQCTTLDALLAQVRLLASWSLPL